MSSTAITEAKNGGIEKAGEGVNTISARFLADVERQFIAEMGSGLKFTEFEKRLTQHMYLRVDAALNLAESKREGQGTEFNWHNIDRRKLALDTVHRVSLGLDALIPNHISPVFYWSKSKGKFDVDLSIGYVGRDFIARRHAVEEPVNIIYELVYSTDEFKVLPRTASNEVAGYEFTINQPFDRGQIVGGFGHIVYDDPRKNRLVLVTQRDFARSKKASKSSFWANNDVEMHYKTVVHRTATKVPLDPEKVNAAAFAAITAEEYQDNSERAEAEVQTEAAQLANRELLDVTPAPVPTVDADPVPTDAGLFTGDDEAPPY